MASSSSFRFVFVSLVILLSFLFVSVSATKFIDGICKNVINNKDKPFCYKTLKAYSPVASATTQLKAVEATLRFAISYADKFSAFAGKAAKENPNLKQDFLDCQNSFVVISNSLRSASMELVDTPETANYDAMVCLDETRMITNLIGKYKDKVSKSIIAKTLMIEKYIDICIGATVAVGG